jgi:cytidylate kinase
MKDRVIITLDGGAGTGKGSIGRLVAEHFGIKYIDTGLYYRAITYLMMKKKLRNMDAIVDEARKMKLEFVDQYTLLNGDKLSIDLRTKEIDDNVGEISLFNDVRQVINEKIREAVSETSAILDGRDCGSVIYPTADYKFFITCDVETRAQRRYEQDLALGIENDLDNIRENIKKRDEIDKNRQFGTLIVPKDAIIVDTSGKTLEESVQQVIDFIEGE